MGNLRLSPVPLIPQGREPARLGRTFAASTLFADQQRPPSQVRPTALLFFPLMGFTPFFFTLPLQLQEVAEGDKRALGKG